MLRIQTRTSLRHLCALIYWYLTFFLKKCFFDFKIFCHHQIFLPLVNDRKLFKEIYQKNADMNLHTLLIIIIAIIVNNKK